MNGAHWHLVVNHLPIIFPIVGIIILLTGFISKSEVVKRTALFIFTLGAISAFAAMASGEGAEEVVETISGVDENYIKIHEEAAEIFAILSYILGAVSLLGLWASFKQKTYASIVSIVILIFAFVILFFAQRTGTSGGEIRHTEIRSTSSIPAGSNMEAETEDND